MPVLWLNIVISSGGDQLDSYQDVRSPAFGTLVAKIHFNSDISDAHKGELYCTTDIKDFYYVLLFRFIRTCAFIFTLSNLK